jgi:SAM-dependent methyltransferase
MDIDKRDIDKKRAQTFNQIAQLYNAARPSYPLDLIEDVIKLAQLSEPDQTTDQITGQILEIGAGTGKATLPFAQRGYRIHCLEPGDQMAVVAAENLRAYPNVTFEITTFEDWPLQTSTYSLVMSAQAFHWVDPEIGYRKAAQALKPGGSLALIWNLADEAKSMLAQELDQIYTAHGDWRLQPFEERQQQSVQALSESSYFLAPTVKQYAWSQHYTTQQYLDLVSTQSDYLIKPAEQQRELLAAISTVLDPHGGIVRPYVSLLLLAKTSPEP